MCILSKITLYNVYPNNDYVCIPAVNDFCYIIQLVYSSLLTCLLWFGHLGSSRACWKSALENSYEEMCDQNSLTVDTVSLRYFR